MTGKTGLFKTALSGQMFDALPVWDHLAAAAENGYDAVQLRSTHVAPQTPAPALEAIQAFVKEKGLAINGLSCFVGNYGLLEGAAESEKAFQQFRLFVDLAVKLAAPLVRVWPGWQESATAPREVWARAAAGMRKSADYAADKGVKLAMEMHHGTLCDTADAAQRLLEEIGRENTGVILDPTNLYQVPTDYGPAAIRKLGHRIFDVHIKDIVRLAGDYFPYAFKYSFYAGHIGRFARVVPPAPGGEERFYCHRRINQGGVDWSSVIAGLKAIGYREYVTVESVCENNRLMPGGKELAAACYRDMTRLFSALADQG